MVEVTNKEKLFFNLESDAKGWNWILIYNANMQQLEVQGFHNDDLDYKKQYITNTYSDDLKHKFANGISIVGYYNVEVNEYFFLVDEFAEKFYN